jgi:hypothetical protein
MSGTRKLEPRQVIERIAGVILTVVLLYVIGGWIAGDDDGVITNKREKPCASEAVIEWPGHTCYTIG